MTLTQRISRCESRMQSARCVKWRFAWYRAWSVAKGEIDAIRAVREVRA
jgi:hypothetical protein